MISKAKVPHNKDRQTLLERPRLQDSVHHVGPIQTSNLKFDLRTQRLNFEFEVRKSTRGVTPGTCV